MEIFGTLFKYDIPFSNRNLPFAICKPHCVVFECWEQTHSILLLALSNIGLIFGAKMVCCNKSTKIFFTFFKKESSSQGWILHFTDHATRFPATDFIIWRHWEEIISYGLNTYLWRTFKKNISDSDSEFSNEDCNERCISLNNAVKKITAKSSIFSKKFNLQQASYSCFKGHVTQSIP